MLTLNVLKSGIEEYFLGIADPDYYLKGGEPPGQWFGRGAAVRGLVGRVEAEAFRRVLESVAPDGMPPQAAGQARSKRLTSAISKPARTERVPAYDLCFSAPKSVSVMWAVGPSYLRKAIDDAFDAAVKQTLDWFSSKIPLCRRGRGGRQEKLAELVVAMFDHSTSRVTQNGDWQPNRHRHCVVANSAFADGRWSAVNSRRLHEWARTLGPMFRAILATELMARLDISLDRPIDEAGRRASWFEISGVSPELCERWSSRRHEIEELLAGDASLGSASDATARERANLLTRKAKSLMPPRSELLSRWKEVAKQFGVTPQSLEGLTNHRQPLPDRERAFTDCWQEAISTIEATQATFTERDAIRAVCEAGQALGVSGIWLTEKVREKLAADDGIRCLGAMSGEKQFVTNDMWRREERLLENFEKLRSASGVNVHDEVIASALSKHKLSDEQQEVVRDILRSQRSLRILNGVAGAGKQINPGASRTVIALNIVGAFTGGLDDKIDFLGGECPSGVPHISFGVPTCNTCERILVQNSPFGV